MTGAEFLVAAVCDVVVLCLVALILVRLLPHHPAKRYVVCLASLIAFWSTPAILVAQSLTGIGIVRIPLPYWLQEDRPIPRVVTAHQPHDLAGVVGAGSHVPLPWFWIGFGVWSIGSLIALGRLTMGYRTMKRIVRGASPWNSACANETLSGLASFHRARLCPVLESKEITVPTAAAALKPVILLPDGIEATLSPNQLRQVLVHEASHVNLHHLPVAFVVRLTSIIFWPIPLIHFFRREVSRAQEEICDNVASQVDGATCYARTLLKVAQGLSPAPPSLTSLALLGPEISVESRIAGLLNPRRNTMITIKNWQLAAVASATIASMACIRLASAHTPPRSFEGSQLLELTQTKAFVVQTQPVIVQKPSFDQVAFSSAMTQLAPQTGKTTPKHLAVPKRQETTSTSARDEEQLRKLIFEQIRLNPPKLQVKVGGIVVKTSPSDDERLRKQIVNSIHLSPPTLQAKVGGSLSGVVARDEEQLRKLIVEQLRLNPPKLQVTVSGSVSTPIHLGSMDTAELIKAFRKAHQ